MEREVREHVRGRHLLARGMRLPSICDCLSEVDSPLLLLAEEPQESALFELVGWHIFIPLGAHLAVELQGLLVVRLLLVLAQLLLLRPRLEL